MKKIRIAAIAGLILVAVLALVAWAGDKEHADHGQMDVAQMKEMFSKCYMCKNMVPYMEKAWYPSLNWEVYDTKNGMLMVEHVGDKSGMADYKLLFASLEKAGEEIHGWSDAQVKKQLCEHCQGMFSLIKAGAVDDWALTRDGSVGVIVSSNPETVKMIHAQAAQMRTMMGLE
ncbi:MAG: hypothetical protein L0Y74_00325 [candidate division Zixibacteria bacterium]|nr:hypothetical protein [candidate division Zixibacteria bacterium]